MSEHSEMEPEQPSEDGAQSRKSKPKRKRRPQLTHNEKERVIWAVAERFVRGMRAEEIVVEIREHLGLEISRESVYPYVHDAYERKYFVLTPPPDVVMTDKLRDLARTDRVHVVDSFGSVAPDSVAAFAAKHTHDLIMEIGQKRPEQPVHVAFGVGRMTHQIIRDLAARLDPTDAPPLCIHALSPSYSVEQPRDTPLTAFDDLCRHLPKVTFADLAAPPFVNAENYDSLYKNGVIREGFDKSSEVDIVISSLACQTDPHGYLRRMLERFAPKTIERLVEHGWIGDVHLSPFSAQGPIVLTEDAVRPVVLYQMQELATFAQQQDKHVILLGSHCGVCRATKEAALLPLITQPALRCWNTLIVDRNTAARVLGVNTSGGPWE